LRCLLKNHKIKYLAAQFSGKEVRNRIEILLGGAKYEGIIIINLLQISLWFRDRRKCEGRVPLFTFLQLAALL
jgi:hypothetical protein